MLVKLQGSRGPSGGGVSGHVARWLWQSHAIELIPDHSSATASVVVKSFRFSYIPGLLLFQTESKRPNNDGQTVFD